MKKLGIIGGIGPEATVNYYLDVIKGTQKTLGTNKQLPEIVINSINMYHMFDLLEQKDYLAVVAYLVKAVNELQAAGADFGLMCGNTPHIVFDQIQQQTSLPLLSIVTTALKRAQSSHLSRLALLGTKFTMQNTFFSQPFIDAGIKVVLPNPDEQTWLHQKIVDELENGVVKRETKQQLLKMTQRLIQQYQLDGLILGCTELPLILQPTDFSIAVLDIAKIHIETAIQTSLN
ncbi:aspartate/glutamate racemase family protein [Oenococcus kitaharae]|uniref:Aspartate racemase n=1 Tax=Oenococcus kitaharae DSM 17330 TaxID=1045004 RepID=G9WJH3_9LACO|nr:amino acid racemase [Oenococcus kitaharae]EHN59018.1 Aspartate racemase [Oenococcus kitaharae DSM 17330]OEY84212.1 aspartate racemase [Oenococcus kitaharae]OEY84786.1 aspartate racemase [Oenococcus kitaharae]OEY85734.1 aspartate racemase [Oenococcus kitaharae]